MMTCRRTKRYIALWVGDDLDDESQNTVRQHVARCPSCQDHFERMQASFGRLQQRTLAEEFRRYDSLWPDVKQKLPLPAVRSTPEFNGWWAALAVCLACVALLTVWQKETRISSVAGGRDVPVQTVNEAEQDVELSSAPLMLQPEQSATVQPLSFEEAMEVDQPRSRSFFESLFTDQPSTGRYYSVMRSQYVLPTKAFRRRD